MRYTIAVVLVLCGCFHGIQDNPTVEFHIVSVVPDTVPAGGQFYAHATVYADACSPQVQIQYAGAQHILAERNYFEGELYFDSGALTAYAGDTVVTFAVTCPAVTEGAPGGTATAGPINRYLHVT